MRDTVFVKQLLDDVGACVVPNFIKPATKYCFVFFRHEASNLGWVHCHLMALMIFEKSSLHTLPPLLPLSGCHWVLIDRLLISSEVRAITTHCDGSLPSKELGFKSSKPMHSSFLLAARSARIGFKSRL